MLAKATATIELTEEQRDSIQKGGAVRVQDNGREYALLRPECTTGSSMVGATTVRGTRRRWIGLREESAACSTVTLGGPGDY